MLLEANHQVAGADADQPLVGDHPHHRGVEGGAGPGVPTRPERRVQRQAMAGDVDARDFHACNWCRRCAGGQCWKRRMMTAPHATRQRRSCMVAAFAEEPGDEGASAMLQDFTHDPSPRSEEHTSELQSLMRISYAVFCLKKKK